MLMQSDLTRFTTARTRKTKTKTIATELEWCVCVVGIGTILLCIQRTTIGNDNYKNKEKRRRFFLQTHIGEKR